MANESKTELITIDHFRKYKDQIVFEWKSSDNPTINKLLKNASKKWSGKGFPDFIISVNANSDLLIVIECKADVRKHESQNRDKFSDYAVDWVLLYSDSLSKEFDILSIAISWDDERNLKVSHFLQLKNEKKSTQVFWDKLLSIDDYLNWYLKSPEKFRQDYNKLLSFTKDLNESLHGHKILEWQRSLLISCILIALEYRPFREWYKHYENSRDLSNYLVDTVVNSLKTANIQWDKLENLWIQFSFIRTDTSLSTKQNVLKNLIKDIDENINQFIKTHEYFDVLWQLYIEFLRYANSDKWLWIVLTPPHITDFFSELAQVNKSSIVYDNCTWTWWFLISAMKKMIEDAKWDEEIIKNIKSKQLIWTEYQAHIFALAVSNMYIHQDGKTNIMNWSCFDQDIINKVKKLNPTVWFLNPPYKSKKKKDTEEFEFLLNNLDCLSEWWTCIAIIPMSNVIWTTETERLLKRKILENHTLEAVFSMPNELFHNSDVAVNTCVIVIKAKQKHPKWYKTYFWYCKDDWFIKIKNLWRVDFYNKYSSIKDRWLELYRNKEELDWYSIKKEVSWNDEWCAEAYMKTDYSKLHDDDFAKNIKSYLAYKLLKDWYDVSISEKSIINKINLQDREWGVFDYDLWTEKSVFKIKKWKRLTKKDQWDWEIPYVSSSSLNNWIDNYIDNWFTDENCISFACYWSIWEVFYHDNKVWVSDNANVFYIRKWALNKYIAMFLITILKLEQFRFSYWMTWKKDRLVWFTIKLPIDKDWNPDWDFMENYIKSLPYSSSL